MSGAVTGPRIYTSPAGCSGPAILRREEASTMRIVLIALLGTLIGSSVAAADTPTFYKDVLPILQANCQTCHRPGEVAQMPLLTSERAPPGARGIQKAVVPRQIPPWFADPKIGHFAN